MKIVSASENVRASIHAIIVGQMAAALIASGSDLSDQSACRSSLIEIGFGELSVSHLLTRAIDAARLSLAATAKQEK